MKEELIINHKGKQVLNLNTLLKKNTDQHRLQKEYQLYQREKAHLKGFVRLHEPAQQVVLTAMRDNDGAKLESSPPLILLNSTEDNRNEDGSNERNSGLHILFPPSPPIFLLLHHEIILYL